jgi:hypothetical protein
MGIDDGADDGNFGLSGHGNRVNLNDLADRADLQLRVDTRSLTYVERNPFQSTGLKAQRFYGYRVAPGW